MRVVIQCVAKAIVAKGIRGLAEFVPGGPFLYDVAEDALKRLKEERNQKEIREDLREAAQASFEDARRLAGEVAKGVAGTTADGDRLALELYLSQVPGAVRRSLRRSEDPTGQTVPVGLALESPDDVLRLLPPSMPRFRPGDRLPGGPGWKLLEPLGAGGFGEVWRAGHDLIPHFRAVKFCTDLSARHQLLTHEGKLIARVMKVGHHPNVVGLVDAHLDGEVPWLAYEYVSGGDLSGMILAGQMLPIEERVKRAVEALRVLTDTTVHFHQLAPPIIHRDLKPANILVTEDGALKITDFGIGGIGATKVLSSSQGGLTAYTRAAAMLAGAFTPIYASPQQQRGEPPDPRDDIHALGVIGYQLLTGRIDLAPGPRFDRDLRAIGAPPELIEVIGDCIDPDPARRPARPDTRFASLAARLNPTPLGPNPPGPKYALTAGPTAGLEAENLRRWEASGAAAKWVEQREAKWDERAWQDLLTQTRAGNFWPMWEADMAALLERLKQEHWAKVCGPQFNARALEIVPPSYIRELLREWLASTHPALLAGPGSQDFVGAALDAAIDKIRATRFWPIFACREEIQAELTRQATEIRRRTAERDAAERDRKLAEAAAERARKEAEAQFEALRLRCSSHPEARENREEYLSKRPEHFRWRDQYEGQERAPTLRARVGAAVRPGLILAVIGAVIGVVFSLGFGFMTHDSAKASTKNRIATKVTKGKLSDNETVMLKRDGVLYEPTDFALGHGVPVALVVFLSIGLMFSTDPRAGGPFERLIAVCLFSGMAGLGAAILGVLIYYSWFSWIDLPHPYWSLGTVWALIGVTGGAIWGWMGSWVDRDEARGKVWEALGPVPDDCPADIEKARAWLDTPTAFRRKARIRDGLVVVALLLLIIGILLSIRLLTGADVVQGRAAGDLDKTMISK